jgi:hypothetical protein
VNGESPTAVRPNEAPDLKVGRLQSGAENLGRRSPVTTHEGGRIYGVGSHPDKHGA